MKAGRWRWAAERFQVLTPVENPASRGRGGFEVWSQQFSSVLASSRRVKKGPVRRPLSAKRQRFMELRARGRSVRAAAREVGVSRSAATNWTRGYKTYRNGVEVGFVPPLDPLLVRQVSPRFLSQDDRIGMADPRRAGL